MAVRAKDSTASLDQGDVSRDLSTGSVRHVFYVFLISDPSPLTLLR